MTGGAGVGGPGTNGAAGSGLSTLEKARIVLVGVVAPALIVLLGWRLTLSWQDLPGEIPSHWQGEGATSFSAPADIISSWVFGASFAALAAMLGTAAMAWGWQWSRLSRGFSATLVGVTGAVMTGLVLSLAVARGLTTEQVVERGAGPGMLGVFGGFALWLVLALWAWRGLRPLQRS
ncbi:MAG: hypothetical protein ACTJGT_09445 [Microbacteriaceae bacterium]